MPIYEYICLNCQNRFETLIMSSDEQPTCPKCASASLERLLSPFARAAGEGAGTSAGCGPSGGFS
jgi:putative FmdB family regulatory protein